MEYSQTAQMNGPATIGEKRNRHVVLELANGTSVQKLLIGLLVAPLEAPCGPSPVKGQFCTDAKQLLSLWGHVTFTITT
jgi:hypothetical protein